MPNTTKQRFAEKFGNVIKDQTVVDVGGDTDEVSMHEELLNFIEEEKELVREEARKEFVERYKEPLNRLLKSNEELKPYYQKIISLLTHPEEPKSN